MCMSIENELLNTGLQDLFLSHSLSRNELAYIYIYIYVCMYVCIYIYIYIYILLACLQGVWGHGGGPSTPAR